MTEPTQSVMNDLRATLWRRVGDATHANVADLATVLVGLQKSPADVASVERGVQLAHSVAGSAGVYGFQDEAHAANDLEELLRDWTGRPDISTAIELLARLQRGFQVST